MKKQIIYSSILAATILAGTAVFIVNDNNASTTTNDTLAVASSDLVTVPKINTSKDESVFIIANQDGSTDRTFVGSTIYDGDATLPLDFHVSYYLDDNEISATDLSGKSGHVKIIFNAKSSATYLDKKVPFLAITGATLDNNIFTNIKLTNGKIVKEGNETVVVGYTMPGINEDLGADFMPAEFIIEADANSFKLKNTYTVITNSLFADLDTSKLSDLDSLVSLVNQLGTGLDQIIVGSTDLKNGLETLLVKSKELTSGINDLSTGLTAIAANNEALNSSAAYFYAALAANPTTPPELLAGYQAFCDSLNAYTTGVASAAAGASMIAENMPTLINGETDLYNGSVKLTDGLNTYKTTGINKLVNFANNDIASFTYNARRTVEAAASYKNFTNPNAESVKFIIKTPSI